MKWIDDIMHYHISIRTGCLASTDAACCYRRCTFRGLSACVWGTLQ